MTPVPPYAPGTVCDRCGVVHVCPGSGFPEPTPTVAQHPSENHRPPLGASHV